jgi:hypothetical protein
MGEAFRTIMSPIPDTPRRALLAAPSPASTNSSGHQVGQQTARVDARDGSLPLPPWRRWAQGLLKHGLVALGQYCLARGWHRGVAAITWAIRRGGLSGA